MFHPLRWECALIVIYKEFSSFSRIIKTAPTVAHQIYRLTKYVIEFVQEVLEETQRKHQQALAHATVSCDLEMSEYGQGYIQKRRGHRESMVDFVMETRWVDPPIFFRIIHNHSFTPSALGLTIERRSLTASRHRLCCFSQHRSDSSASIPVPNVFRPSTVDEHALAGSGDVDAFEHILEVTKYQEAIIAYYYLDDDNKMKMTQIFDLTNSEHPSVMNFDEQNANDQLEFDSDWEANHLGESFTFFLIYIYPL